MFNFNFKFKEQYTATVNEETGIAIVTVGNIQQSITIPIPVIQEYLKDPENEDKKIEMRLFFLRKCRSWLCTREETKNKIISTFVEDIKAGRLQGYKLDMTTNTPTLEFTSAINEETSYSSKRISANTTSTMTLYGDCIEWDIEELEITEGIGIQCAQDDNIVDGYDGVFDLPIQAAILLYAAGYAIDTEELCYDENIDNFMEEYNTLVQ